MRVVAWGALLLGCAACSSVASSGDGIVALQVQVPDTLTLRNTQSITLHAVALDIQGNVVTNAQVYWRTPDTVNVSLDSVSGLLTSHSDTGSARVQARVGTLLSDIIRFSLAPDTTATLRRP